MKQQQLCIETHSWSGTNSCSMRWSGANKNKTLGKIVRCEIARERSFLCLTTRLLGKELTVRERGVVAAFPVRCPSFLPMHNGHGSNKCLVPRDSQQRYITNHDIHSSIQRYFVVRALYGWKRITVKFEVEGRISLTSRTKYCAVQNAPPLTR